MKFYVSALVVLLVVFRSYITTTSITVVSASDGSGFGNSEIIDFVAGKNARRKLDDIAGSINIDCGLPDDSTYTDTTTDLTYISDRTFINTGQNYNISPNFSSVTFPLPLANLRSFPQGRRHCYTLRPPEGKASIYLIRASFLYGNYDNQNMLPRFSLYVGVNLWDTVMFENTTHVVTKEIIHVPKEDSVYVCLVNIGLGIPFISALELRHFHNATYEVESGSLVLYKRLDFGSTTDQIIRYHNDVYDRIWSPYNCPLCTSVSTTFTVGSVNNSIFSLPSKVMKTAAQPQDVNYALNFEFDIGDSTSEFYVYMHFAELEILQENQHRQFNILLNGNLLREGIVLKYLRSTTIATPRPVRGAKLSFSIQKTPDSTHPPILNAMEIYQVRYFLQEPTDQEDVNAIEEIKSSYGVDKGWQGDPCGPEPNSWDGLNCSYGGYDSPRIVSLNLSSSELKGYIPSSLSNLRSLQYLDLSHNGLIGRVPEFLSELPLRTLNLEGTKLSGTVPLALAKRSKNGSLSLSVVGNVGLCLFAPCKEVKRNALVPVIATIVPLVVIVTVLTIFWICKNKIGKNVLLNMHDAKEKFLVHVVSKLFAHSQTELVSSIKSEIGEFTYAEIIRITNDFQILVGKGGCGTVYHGFTSDGLEVAVKMICQSSAQAASQFRSEARLLMRVHHRNLASLVGYCNEGKNKGIVYEYMASGNLEQSLLDKTRKPLIALDVAQGLEYLHHGCKGPVIHRDVKSPNILLDENFQAKIADFGFSKLYPIENRSHLSTMVVGTIGYVDPEYYASNRLTEKSDVYSFGVVLLEIITGRPAVIKNHNENTHLLHWITPFLENGDVRSVLDPRLEENVDISSVWKFMEIAISCVPSISIQRPTMSHVVIELKDCLQAEIDREQNEKLEVSSSGDAFKTITVGPETEMGPEAR